MSEAEILKRLEEAQVVALPFPTIFHPSKLEGRSIPERRWCVPGWIPDRTVTSIYGDGGVGKSLLAMQLMTAAALGRDWAGLPTTRRNVLGLFCEDEIEELHRRQAQINNHFGTSFADLDGSMFWTARPGLDSLLMEYDRGREPLETPLSEEIVQFCKSNGVQLLVIDTAADVFGGREIDRLEVRQFINHLRKIAQLIDGAVVLLAHPSVTGLREGTGLSGSTAWSNSVRSRIYLERVEDDPDLRLLRCLKSNYAASGGEPVDLRYSAGAFVPVEPSAAVPTYRDMTAEVRFVAALRQALGNGERPSPAEQARNLYAPRLLLDRPPVTGLPFKRLERIMRDLLGTGELRIATEGPPSKRKQVLAPADWRPECSPSNTPSDTPPHTSDTPASI